MQYTCGSGRASLDAELLKNVLQMFLHCTRAYRKDICDIGISFAPSEPAYHLGFARCKSKPGRNTRLDDGRLLLEDQQ